MKNLLESLNQQFESFFKDANQQAARKTSLTIEKAMKEFRKTSLSVSNK